jgi:hypothetical protein
MQILGGVLGGSFVLASAIVGARLCRLSAETRRFAELQIGAGLLLLAVLGYPLMVVARKAQALGDPTRGCIAFSAALCLAVGGGLIVAFVRGVFRPHAPAARAVLYAYVAAASLVLVGQTFGAGWSGWALRQEGSWAAARWLTLLPICWGGVESLLYWRRMRRRRALGIADPVVTDRFRLFGISMSCGFVANAGTVLCQVLGIEVVGTSLGAVVVSPAGLAAVALWLAFLPPEAYTRRLRRRFEPA